MNIWVNQPKAAFWALIASISLGVAIPNLFPNPFIWMPLSILIGLIIGNSAQKWYEEGIDGKD